MLDVLRLDGINYYGLEPSTSAWAARATSSTSEGTLPVTNVDLNDGDDRVFVSSLANEVLDSLPDYLAGHLDAIAGTLNLDFGSGRHALLVSDEQAVDGDFGVRITDKPSIGLARDPDAAPDAEIFMSGLGEHGGINYRAAPTGNFLDGIAVWTGSGADAIEVEGTHYRTTGRTITSLNTGLGDDT